MTKRGPGRPRVDSDFIGVRMHRATIEEIDALRRAEPDLPNRQEMIRRLLKAQIAQRKGATDRVHDAAGVR